MSARHDFVSASLVPQVAKLLSINGDSAVLFADVMQKVNRHGVLKPKILMITDKSLYVLGSDTFRQRMRIPLKV